MSTTPDPGWRQAFHDSPFGTLHPRPADGLSFIRIAFTVLVAGLVLNVAFLAYAIDAGGDPGIGPAVVAAVGAAAHGAITVIARRPLSTTTSEALAASWRTRFLLCADFAVLPALAGTATAFLTQTTWLYLVGFVASVAAFWRIAPSKPNLARDQERIRVQGSSLDLVGSLISRGPTRR